MSSPLPLDHHGYPVLLAEKEPAKVVPQPMAPSTRPSAIDHTEWARRMDAVREAAREFEELNDQDLKERLKGLTLKPLMTSDLAQFRVDVRAQVLDDLLDALDQRQRGVLRGRRTVRISMPKGYVKKAVNSLTANEIQQIEGRLKARGWDEEQIKALGDKLPEGKKAVLDQFPESDTICFSETQVVTPTDLTEALSQAIKNLPAPQVHVEVQVPSASLNVERDADGRISRIIHS